MQINVANSFRIINKILHILHRGTNIYPILYTIGQDGHANEFENFSITQSGIYEGHVILYR